MGSSGSAARKAAFHFRYSGGKVCFPRDFRLSTARATGLVIPTGLLGMAVLVCALECIVARSKTTGASGSRLSLSWRAAALAAMSPEGRSDVLCFGDSLVKLGILPRVLEKRTGASAYNLAVLGGPAPSSYFLLRRVLEGGGRPKALIAGFSAQMLTMSPRAEPSCWAELADVRDGFDLAWNTVDPKLAASIAACWILPSWCRRDDRPMRLATGRRGVATRHWADDSRAFQRNWRLNRGAQVAPVSFVAIEGALPAPPFEGCDWSWRPHPANAIYVDRFLSLAEVYGIPVFWVLPPLISNWRARLEPAGVIAAYRQFVAVRAERFAGLTVLDGERLDWGRWAFRDPIHLNRDGAVALTVAVGLAMAPRLAEARAPESSETTAAPGRRCAREERWVDLSTPGTGPFKPPRQWVEDLDESRLAVNQRGEGPS
jgi:hypothetical protein